MTKYYVYTGITENLPAGKVAWESPSNIALVKYWGKKSQQLPANPSISFTLNNCKTTTTLSYSCSTELSFEVYVDGKREKGFEPKIKMFFDIKPESATIHKNSIIGDMIYK